MTKTKGVGLENYRLAKKKLTHTIFHEIDKDTEIDIRNFCRAA